MFQFGMFVYGLHHLHKWILYRESRNMFSTVWYSGLVVHGCEPSKLLQRSLFRWRLYSSFFFVFFRCRFLFLRCFVWRWHCQWCRSV